MNESGRRVLIIGLDGATFDLIEPWAAAGYLPTLQRLMREGAWGPLRSTLQPLTAPAWVSFMTGANQGQHGIYDFVRRAEGSYRIKMTDASMIRCPTIFDLVSDQGQRVAVLNMPFTFPPWPINGAMLSGSLMSLSGSQLAYPGTLFREVVSAVGDYIITPDYDPRVADPLAHYAEALLHSIDSRTRAAQYLMSKEPFDLFAVVFTATDLAAHAFWAAMEGDPTADPRFCDTIQAVYRRVDTALAELLDGIDDDTTVIVMSDHGTGRFKKGVLLNTWLAEMGLLRPRDAGHGDWRSLSGRLLQDAFRNYRRFFPSRLRARIRGQFGRHLTAVKGQLESSLTTQSIDWSQTRAYALGAGGNIFINLRGREPEGIVAPGRDYESVRQEIIADLEELRDPQTGELVVARVHRREELYHGPYLDCAPDLVVEWHDYGYWGRDRVKPASRQLFQVEDTFEFSSLPLTGSHRLDGILIAYGATVRAGARIKGAHITDLAPTILCCLGLSAPAFMDGRVLTELLAGQVVPTSSKTQVANVSPERPCHAYSAEEAETIHKRLEELGYL
ncbi:MAG: alkaline phosphatase family protein [Anaerolineae bacterium]|nr:alkaline phosphatase family protein [Anaerolineae bacterium]